MFHNFEKIDLQVLGIKLVPCFSCKEVPIMLIDNYPENLMYYVKCEKCNLTIKHISDINVSNCWNREMISLSSKIYTKEVMVEKI